MIRIDFTQFTVFTDISQTVCVMKDIRKDIANELWTRGQGIACHALALKIYNSEGEQKFTDDEYDLLASFFDQVGTPMMIDAFKKIKENNKQK